jgi:mono/diheme cytochrome c family protein
MYDQPVLETFEATDIFASGTSAQPLPDGVVAQGYLPAGDAESTGRDAKGSLLEEPPVAVDMKLLERGQQRFQIYCTPCHGYDGFGDGAIVRRGFPKPPSYHDERLRGVPIAYFFDVSTHGLGAMPAFGARISDNDRWAISAYIRALQLSQYAPTDDLTEQDRLQLAQPPVRGAEKDTDDAH